MVGALVLHARKTGREEACDWLRQLADLRTTEYGDPGLLGFTLALQSLGEVIEMQEWQAGRPQSRHLEEQLLLIWGGELIQASQTMRKRNRLVGLAKELKPCSRDFPEKVLQLLIFALKS